MRKDYFDDKNYYLEDDNYSDYEDLRYENRCEIDYEQATRNIDYGPPSVRALKAGDNESFKRIFKNLKNPNYGDDGDDYVEGYDDYDNVPLLLIAVRKGNFDISEFLLSKGALSSLQDKKGNSPLYAAYKMGRDDLTWLLLKHNAKMSEKEWARMTQDDWKKLSALKKAQTKPFVSLINKEPMTPQQEQLLKLATIGQLFVEAINNGTKLTDQQMANPKLVQAYMSAIKMR